MAKKIARGPDGYYHCPRILAVGPRAGQVCGARFMPPHEACGRCREREAPPRRRKTPRPASNERLRAAERKRRRQRQLAGIPAGWSV